MWCFTALYIVSHEIDGVTIAGILEDLGYTPRTVRDNYVEAVLADEKIIIRIDNRFFTIEYCGDNTSSTYLLDDITHYLRKKKYNPRIVAFSSKNAVYELL